MLLFFCDFTRAARANAKEGVGYKMFKNFISGFNEAGKVLDRLTEPVAPSAERSTHYRLNWLLYLIPEQIAPPARTNVYSAHHGETRRLPEMLRVPLAPFLSEIAGVFPEPVHATEDLGYLVFADRATARAAAAAEVYLRAAFASAPSELGYLYAEIELAECGGSPDLPLSLVIKNSLLSNGFDGGAASRAKDRTVIEIDSEFVA